MNRLGKTLQLAMDLVQGIRARVFHKLGIDAMVFTLLSTSSDKYKITTSVLIKAILYKQLPRIALMYEQHAMTIHFTNDLP